MEKEANIVETYYMPAECGNCKGIFDLKDLLNRDVVEDIELICGECRK